MFKKRGLEGKMEPQRQSEEAIVPGIMSTETEVDDQREEGRVQHEPMLGFKSFLWHGGSVYDAWFSCASNQVFLKFPFFFGFPLGQKYKYAEFWGFWCCRWHRFF